MSDFQLSKAWLNELLVFYFRLLLFRDAVKDFDSQYFVLDGQVIWAIDPEDSVEVTIPLGGGPRFISGENQADSRYFSQLPAINYIPAIVSKTNQN